MTAVWLPGMDSNHELDKILKAHNLLILKVAEVVKSLKSMVSVQNRYKSLLTNRMGNTEHFKNFWVNLRTASRIPRYTAK